MNGIEFLVEHTILDLISEVGVNGRFTQEDVLERIKSDYKIDADIKTVQTVLSSYITDGIINYDECGYYRGYEIFIR